jgi:quinol monooxygenase YgiN
MPFVVIATWTAKPGEESRIADLLRTMTPLSRAEPGNLFYQAQVGPEAPGVFVLYEQYTDAGAYEAHKCTKHFRENVVELGLDYLERRDVSCYQTLE